MNKIRENKGITMMTLVVTILLMIIILSTITYSAVTSLEIKSLNNMYSDIRILEEKIIMYYFKYKSIPITGTEISFDSDYSINPNDIGGEYYKIDLDLLDSISLTNMKKPVEPIDPLNPPDPKDVYIINTKSHTIYYEKGVWVDGVKYVTVPMEYTQVPD